ncbi:MAG: AcvB/VirJ family lysyl-phosphatidylglycerol hydrolase, partial [Acetobacteraceae bacterium]
QTVALASARRAEVIERIRFACAQGRQAYWICTLVEESEQLDAQAAAAAHAELAAALDALVRKPTLSAGAFADKLEDLPLTEIAPKGKPDGRVVLMISGDGGWAGLDKGVAKVLSEHGVRVVGLSSLEFFWHKKTPQQAAQAVARILAAYTARYPDARYTLMGYSFGAGVVPV